MLTTRFVNGSPNWLDVGTPDMDGAVRFYERLFGWQFQSAGPDAGGYGFFQLSGRTVAGVMQMTEEQGPPAWTPYFQSTDADATTKAVEQAHGAVFMHPTDVMGLGRVAVFADCGGVPFGVWEPASMKGLDAAGESGALCWVELYARDVAAAAAFYHTVLGWETTSSSFPGGSYTMFGPAGTDEEDAFGGLVSQLDDPVEAEAGPLWQPYLAVDDVDATVARAGELGGMVRMPATDIPGVGRVARLADPYGAKFALIKPAPRQG